MLSPEIYCPLLCRANSGGSVWETVSSYWRPSSVPSAPHGLPSQPAHAPASAPLPPAPSELVPSSYTCKHAMALLHRSLACFVRDRAAQLGLVLPPGWGPLACLVLLCSVLRREGQGDGIILKAGGVMEGEYPGVMDALNLPLTGSWWQGRVRSGHAAGGWDKGMCPITAGSLLGMERRKAATCLTTWYPIVLFGVHI